MTLFLHICVKSDKTMLKTFGFLISYLIIVSTSNTCDFNGKITQTLLNEGFHRNITYEVVFNNHNDGNPSSLQGCVVGLDQTLPAGLFANSDELGDLKRAHKLYVVPKNPINIELPAEQSRPSGLYVMGAVRDNRASLWVPVHARYHQATSGGGMAKNEIGPPRLFLRCPEPLPCSGVTMSMPFLCDGTKDCWNTYKEIPHTMTTAKLTWEVPVGNTDHYGAVAGATTLAVVACSLYLLQSMHQYRRARKMQ